MQRIYNKIIIWINVRYRKNFFLGSVLISLIFGGITPGLAAGLGGSYIDNLITANYKYYVKTIAEFDQLEFLASIIGSMIGAILHCLLIEL